jgi:hypothetical protein
VGVLRATKILFIGVLAFDLLEEADTTSLLTLIRFDLPVYFKPSIGTLMASFSSS